MGAIEPRGVASLDLRAMVGRIYVEDHITLLHTKSVSSGPHGSEMKIFVGPLAMHLYINI